VETTMQYTKMTTLELVSLLLHLPAFTWQPCRYYGGRGDLESQETAAWEWCDEPDSTVTRRDGEGQVSLGYNNFSSGETTVFTFVDGQAGFSREDVEDRECA